MNPKVSQLASLPRRGPPLHPRHLRLQRPGRSPAISPRSRPGSRIPRSASSPTSSPGWGSASGGALLENLHLAGGVAPGIAAAKAIAGRDVVMGKSMALRREDLAALGGLEPVKDLLAEDFVIGQMVPRLLGKRVELASRPVQNVVQERTIVAVLPPRPALGRPAARAGGAVALRAPRSSTTRCCSPRWPSSSPRPPGRSRPGSPWPGAARSSTARPGGAPPRRLPPGPAPPGPG